MTSEKFNELQKLKRLDSIQAVLNRAAEIFGNAIMVNDTSYNLLCYAEGIETDDPIWNELMTLGAFSHETVDFFKRENFIMEFAKSETVAIMKSDKLKYDRINGKLFDKDGVQLANALVMGCYKPITDEDIEMLEVLCEILSVHLQNSPLYAHIDRVYQENAFNKLFDGQLPANEADKQAVLSLYDQAKRNLFVAIVDTSQYDETFTHLAYFRDMFRKICPQFFYFVHKENVAVILSTDSPTLNIERDLCELNLFFKKNRICAGISDCFQNLFDAHKYSKQAYAALNCANRDGHDGQFFVYDNFRAEHILLKSDFNANELYNLTAVKIQEYDNENATHYADFLYTCMMYGMHRPVTCQRLGVNAAELDSTLEKVSHLFEIDLANGDMLMNIYITLKLIKSAND